MLIFKSRTLPLSKPIAIKPEWIDYNGHLNMAYYMVIFDNALEDFLLGVGIGENYLKQTNCSYFMADARISYLKEVHLTQKVIIRFRLLDISQKGFHYAMEMLDETGETLHATIEAISLHVDMALKKAVAFPAEIKDNIEKMLVEHKHFDLPAHFGKPFGLRK